MDNTVKNIDSILEKEVSMGNYPSLSHARKSVIAGLVEADIDRRLAKGEEDFKNGNFRVLTPESNKSFLKDLEKKILPHS